MACGLRDGDVPGRASGEQCWENAVLAGSSSSPRGVLVFGEVLVSRSGCAAVEGVEISRAVR